MKLKLQLDEFKDLKDEWNDLNKNMDKLYSLRLIKNGCNPIYQLLFDELSMLSTYHASFTNKLPKNSLFKLPNDQFFFPNLGRVFCPIPHPGWGGV